MVGLPYAYIDIIGNSNDYKFVLKAPNGQIVNVLENNKQIQNINQISLLK